MSGRGEFRDITRSITESTAVFPGDTTLSREILCDLERGDNITLSTMRSTVHLGTHADGPNHYGKGGRSVEEQPIDLYVGHCQVVRVAVDPGRRVGVADLRGTSIELPRVLIATDSAPDTERWYPDFNGLEPDLVDHLADAGVRLVGVDTPSVDAADSKDLPAHSRFFARDLAIIEGLDLHGIEEGRYELIALPLKLRGFDGSPVRAILRTI